MDIQRDTEQILRELKLVILHASKQARKGEKPLNNDRLKNIARVSNAYSKILKLTGEKERKPDADPMEHGLPDFYESISSE